MITHKDRKEIRKILLTFDKVKNTSEEKLTRLIDDFLDYAIDYGYELANIKAEIYYYLKDLGWC